MSAMPTIFELAYAKLIEPEHYTDLLQRVDPGCIPHLATLHLRRAGAKAVGDPGLVAFATRKAEEEIVEILDHIVRSSERPGKAGRPPAEIERDYILTAAFFMFRRKGLGLTAARQQAAKFLGSPITKDQVEKATTRYVKRTWTAFRPLLPEGEVWRLGARVLSDVTHLLNDCELERDRLRRVQCARRNPLSIASI